MPVTIHIPSSKVTPERIARNYGSTQDFIDLAYNEYHSARRVETIIQTSVSITDNPALQVSAAGLVDAVVVANGDSQHLVIR